MQPYSHLTIVTFSQCIHDSYRLACAHNRRPRRSRGELFRGDKMIKHLIGVFCLVGVFGACTVPAWAQAQSSSADLSGSVFDPSKALVSGATVTAINLETGLMRSVTTDATGNYRISLLPPGNYEVRVKADGFSTQSKRGIVLTVGQTVVIKFDLLLGLAAET